MEELKIGTPEQTVLGEVRINEKSDFPLAMRLMHDGQEQPWPQVDFKLKATVEGCLNVYRAQRVGNVFTHCRVDEGRLLVFFDNHGLHDGFLKIEITFSYPDSDYTTDGLRQETFSATSNIHLVKDTGDALSLKLPEPKVVEKVVEKIVHESGYQGEANLILKKAIEVSPDVASISLVDESTMEGMLALYALAKIKEEATNTADTTTLMQSLDDKVCMAIANPLQSDVEQLGYVELGKAYCANSNWPIKDIHSMFSYFRGAQLVLTLSGECSMSNFLMAANIGQLHIHLTRDFQLQSYYHYQSHEEWAQARNAIGSPADWIFGSLGYGAKIEMLHLSWDSEVNEEALTLLAGIPWSMVMGIALQLPDNLPPDFPQWLLEALKPKTEEGKNLIGDVQIPIQKDNGTSAAPSQMPAEFTALSAEFVAKGYSI